MASSVCSKDRCSMVSDKTKWLWSMYDWVALQSFSVHWGLANHSSNCTVMVFVGSAVILLPCRSLLSTFKPYNSWKCGLKGIFRGAIVSTHFNLFMIIFSLVLNLVAFGDVVFCSLWSPYVIGQTIIFSSCSFFLSSSSFFFFPRLISAVGDWMSTILLHMAWP